MEQITNYVKPELIVVAIALYFVGMALKQAQAVKDKYIPAYPWWNKHCNLRNLCVCHLHLRYRTGYCNGNFYSDYTGNTDCWSFYIREPDCKTGK